MRRKIITTVMTLAIVGSFAYLATADAVSVKQNLHEQNTHIEKLNTEYVEVDARLDQTANVKEKIVKEVHKLETETQDAIAERKKLEAELGAN